MSRMVFAALALVACAEEPVDTGVIAHPPVVHDLEVDQDNYVAGLTFHVSDPDGDLEDGMLRVGMDGVGLSYKIGDDAPLSDSTVRIERRFSPCDVPRDVEVVAVVEDAGGLDSERFVDGFQLEGDVLAESEPNDRGSGESDAFAFEDGRAICGDLSSTGVDAENAYAGDRDDYLVEPRVEGTWTITLRAAKPSARFDVWIEAAGTAEPHRADSDVVSFEHPMQPGAAFWLSVAAASGPPGAYSITFE